MFSVLICYFISRAANSRKRTLRAHCIIILLCVYRIIKITAGWLAYIAYSAMTHPRAAYRLSKPVKSRSGTGSVDTAYNI